MRTTRINTLLCVLGACFALASCGDDDEPTRTLTTPTGQAAAEESAEAGRQTPGAQGTTVPEATTEPEATAEPSESVEPEKTVEGLPSATPEPGPPARFGAVITADAITVDTKTVPAGKSLEVQLRNDSDKMVPIDLTWRGITVASGQIEPGKAVPAQVRNLDPGKLILTSGKLRTTVKVVED